MPQAAEQHGVHGVDVGGDLLAFLGLEDGHQGDDDGHHEHSQADPPAAAEEHGDSGNHEDDAERAKGGVAVAAQGDVKIILQPTG